MTDYEDGYHAFSDDESGRIGRAVAEHMMGGIHMHVTLEWLRGYNDAAEDFYKLQRVSQMLNTTGHRPSPHEKDDDT